jgi:hypothetical protein
MLVYGVFSDLDVRVSKKVRLVNLTWDDDQDPKRRKKRKLIDVNPGDREAPVE